MADMPKFKELTKLELDWISTCFKGYIFYSNLRDGTRECECSACNKFFIVGGRTITDEDYEILTSCHNDEVICPHCKRKVTLKNKGKAKGCKNLYEEQRVVVFKRVNANNVQAIARIAYKEYSPYNYRPDVCFLGYNKSCYEFKPGKVRQFKYDYYWGWHEQKTPTEPFNKKTCWWYLAVCDNSYTLLGLSRLANTFLKYHQLDRYCDEYAKKRNSTIIEFSMMSYFCRLCEYPQIEILQKMGFHEVVESLVETGIKSFPYVNWKAKDLAGFFKLSKQEFREFRAAGGQLEILRLRRRIKKLGGEDSIKAAVRVRDMIDQKYKHTFLDNLTENCESKGLNALVVLKYLYNQEMKNRALGSIDSRKREYFDYLNMAQKLEYDLRVHNVLYPKNLRRAHDLAVETYNAHKAEIIARENAKKERAAEKLLLKKDRQYCFTDGRFLITVPHTVAEIIAEGKKQSHCVGGYAARHLAGALTICFLREVSKPEESFYTIEMHDKNLTQVQGYKNSTPLTPEAKMFFDLWLKWVKDGSRRNKAGEPVFKKK